MFQLKYSIYPFTASDSPKDPRPKSVKFAFYQNLNYCICTSIKVGADNKCSSQINHSYKSSYKSKICNEKVPFLKFVMKYNVENSFVFLHFLLWYGEGVKRIYFQTLKKFLICPTDIYIHIQKLRQCCPSMYIVYWNELICYSHR